MTNIFSLPREMVVRIFSLLPYSDLISVGRTCKHLRDSSKDDILMRRLAARIRSSWSDPDHWPAGAEVRCAAGLVTRGQLEEDVVTALAARIQSPTSPTIWAPETGAEVECAAALAATGHLTSVKYMRLCDMELPSSEDMPSLARVVSRGVELVNVGGDVGPLVTSLTCTALWIEDMELDQAATSSLVRALQHGVQELTLAWGVRLHTQTLVEYDWQGRCERCVQVDYYEDKIFRDNYADKMWRQVKRKVKC